MPDNQRKENMSNEVNRYIQEYAPDGKPSFIEGATFKMLIPLPEFEVEKNDGGVNDGAIDGAKEKLDVVNDVVNDAVKRGIIDAVNDAVNDGLIGVVNLVNQSDNGVSINGLIESIGKSHRTVQRYLQILKTLDLIEFKGASKTGKYYLTKKMKEKLKR